MNNLYESPKSDLTKDMPQNNNSGMKEDVFPEGIKGWSWGTAVPQF